MNTITENQLNQGNETAQSITITQSVRIDRKQLLKELRLLSQFAPKRSPKPILENVHINIQPDRIILSIDNLELRIESQLNTWYQGRPFQFCTPIKELKSKLTKLKSDDITFNVTDQKLTLDSNGLNISLNWNNPEEFPESKTNSLSGFGHTETIQLGSLLDTFNSLKRSIAKEHTRYALYSVHMVRESRNQLSFHATNGHSMALIDMAVESINQDYEVLLQPNLFLALEKYKFKKADRSKYLSIQVLENECLLCCGHLKIYARNVEGRFPNVNQVMKDIGSSFIKIDGELFRQFINDLVLMQTDIDHQVTIEFNENRIIGYTNGNQSNSIELKLPFASILNLKPTFDINKLKDISEAMIDCYEIEIVGRTNLSAFLFQSYNNKQVLMPLNLSKPQPTD